MAKTLYDILGHETMLGTVDTVRGKLGTGGLPAGFFNSNGSVLGRSGTYLRKAADRKVARTNRYGAPATVRELKGIAEIAVTLLHTYEKQQHDPLVLQNLLNYSNPQAQDRGAAEIDRHSGEFMARFGNLRLAAVHSILNLGKIYFDSEGNLLPSSSGADTSKTVDFAVPTAHTDNTLISASWATASTDILGDINAHKDAAVRETGIPLRYAFVGSNIYKYIANNTIAKELLKTDSGLASAIRQRGSFDLAGITFIPANEAFFEDNDGTNQSWWGADQIVWTPEPDSTWWDMLEGTYLIPTDIGYVGPDAAAATGSLVEVTGMFNYATVTYDPVGVAHYAGDTFLPVLKVPSAIWIENMTNS